MIKKKEYFKLDQIINNQKKIMYLMICFFGLILITFGALLNNIAVSVNDGKMPVYASSIFKTDSKMHFVTDDWENINKPILGDIFRIKNLHFSIGDIIILSGMIFIIYGEIVFWKFKLTTKR